MTHVLSELDLDNTNTRRILRGLMHPNTTYNLTGYQTMSLCARRAAEWRPTAVVCSFGIDMNSTD